MEHQLHYVQEVGNDVLFECSLCHQRIQFNKEGIGEPCAVQDAAVTVPPIPVDPVFGEVALEDLAMFLAATSAQAAPELLEDCYC